MKAPFVTEILSGESSGPPLAYFSVSGGCLKLAFFILHIIGGYIGMTLLAATLFLRKAKSSRQTTIMIMFCISWLAASVSYTIYLWWMYVTPSSSNSLNIIMRAQPALVYGSQMFTTLATVVVVINLWSAITRSILAERLFDHKLMLFFLLFLVTAASFATFLATLLTPTVPVLPLFYYTYAAPHPSPTYFHTFHINTVILLSQIFISACCFPLEAHILWIIFRRSGWRTQHSGELNGAVLRITAFTVLRFLTFIAVFLIIFENQPGLSFTVAHPLNPQIPRGALPYVVYDMLQACLPLAAFFIFASRKDILSTWFDTLCLPARWLRAKGAWASVSDGIEKDDSDSEMESDHVEKVLPPPPVIVIGHAGRSPITTSELSAL